MRVWATAVFAVAILLMSSVPVQANPAVPYCGEASAGGTTSSTSDLNQPEICMQKTGRVFPEAIADSDYLMAPGSPAAERGYVCTDLTPNGACTGFVNDFIGYFEFQAGLEYLAAQHPDFIEVHEVALSAGVANRAGGPDRNPVYVLEISNENSPIPRDEKQNLLFMLSIHGNEKGGREGGFRVAEDLLRDIGFASETVMNGAGLSSAIEKPTGGSVESYHDYLDFMNIFLLFPNTDGWACDEIEYGVGATPFGPTPAGGGCAGMFTRGNGNGVDLNRQTPTIGWHNPNRDVLGQPESGGDSESGKPGFANWLVQQREQSNGTFQWDYAIDIHGMLNHRNFGAIMMPAGSFSPQEMHRSVRLAESVKERWNLEAGPGGHFQEWGQLFGTIETSWDAAEPARLGADPAYQDVVGMCQDNINFGNFFGCPLPGSALSGESPSMEAGSAQFAEYYTVIDAIGYTDSGFNGDFFAQTTGLNAPGYDIELAYNHLNCGSQYEPPCSTFNDYHVWMVRHIVKSFMDAAAVDAQISYETGGLKTAYVPPTYVATNLDDGSQTPGGWADENPNDDAWDYGPDQPFQARPARYWEDMQPFLCQDCGTETATPGVLEARNADQLNAEALANFDNLIIAGTAINQFVSGNAGENQVASGVADMAKLNAIKDWVDAGGNLVLTDASLSFLELAGIVEGDAVQNVTRYMGGIKVDLDADGQRDDHELLAKVNDGTMQMVEPTPLGFGTTRSVPNWFLTQEAADALGAEIVGRECGVTTLNSPTCDDHGVALGRIAYGDGTIHIMGALLPDPTEEFYHPYGLDNYATTYSANQIVRNLLGWDEVFAEPPVTIADGKVIQSDNERELADASEGDGGDKDADGKDSPGFGLVLGLIALAFMGLRRRNA